MKNIIDIYNVVNPKIDAHSHFFDGYELLSDIYTYPGEFTKVIGGADYCFETMSKYKDHKIVDHYSRFILNNYDKSKHVLLATAPDVEDIMLIHKMFPTQIKGFGELKCYGEYRGKKLPYGNLEWIKPLLDYNVNYKLPVYIHWVFSNEDAVKEFERLLIKYDFPIVLCHLGMGFNVSERHNYDFAFKSLLELQHKYDNLWLDISFKAVDFLIIHPDKFNKLRVDRILLGSDINPRDKHIFKDRLGTHIKATYRNIDKLYNKCHYVVNDNANKLFNITC